MIQLNTTQYDIGYLQAEATEFSGLYDQYPNCKIDLKKYIEFERHIIPQGYGYSFDANYEIKCGSKPTEHYLCENFEFDQEFPDPDCPKSNPRKGIHFDFSDHGFDNAISLACLSTCLDERGPGYFPTRILGCTNIKDTERIQCTKISKPIDYFFKFMNHVQRFLNRGME